MHHGSWGWMPLLLAQRQHTIMSSSTASPLLSVVLRLQEQPVVDCCNQAAAQRCALCVLSKSMLERSSSALTMCNLPAQLLDLCQAAFMQGPKPAPIALQLARNWSSQGCSSRSRIPLQHCIVCKVTAPIHCEQLLVVQAMHFQKCVMLKSCVGI